MQKHCLLFHLFFKQFLINIPECFVCSSLRFQVALKSTTSQEVKSQCFTSKNKYKSLSFCSKFWSDSKIARFSQALWVSSVIANTKENILKIQILTMSFIF